MAEPALQRELKRAEVLRVMEGMRRDPEQERLALAEAGGRFDRFLALLESVNMDEEIVTDA